MKNLTKIFIFISLGLLGTSCMITGVAGSKHVTSESRDIPSDFTGIEVKQGIEVQLTQDNNPSLTVEMDDNLHKLLVTEVKEGVLQIYFSENVGKRKASTVYITMPNIQMIHTSSGASVRSNNTIKTPDLQINTSSGSEVNLRVTAKNITAKSSSGSQIVLKGGSDNLDLTSSSGSEIDTDDLITKNVEAKASSGSDIHLKATEHFTGKASSGASIDCSGNPSEKNMSKSSGGSIQIR